MKKKTNSANKLKDKAKADKRLKKTALDREAFEKEIALKYAEINNIDETDENSETKKLIVKMNGLYKAGFILLMICIPWVLSSIAVAYLYDKWLSAVFSGGGAFLAFLGIIFVMKSKEKQVDIKIVPSKTDEIQNISDETENLQ